MAKVKNPSPTPIASKNLIYSMRKDVKSGYTHNVRLRKNKKKSRRIN